MITTIQANKVKRIREEYNSGEYNNLRPSEVEDLLCTWLDFLLEVAEDSVSELDQSLDWARGMLLQRQEGIDESYEELPYCDVCQEFEDDKGECLCVSASLNEAT